MMKRAAGARFISFSGSEAGKPWTVGGTLREVMMSRGRPAAEREGHLRRPSSTEEGGGEQWAEQRSSPSSGHQLYEGSPGSDGSGQLNDCSHREQHRRRDGNRINGRVE